MADRTPLTLSRWMRPVLWASLLALGLGGCNTLGLSRSPAGNGNMANQYVDRGFRGDLLTSRMKPVSLRLTNGWQPASTGQLHPSADLEAYNPDERMFLVVLGENRASVAPGNLEDQATFYLQILKGGFSEVLDTQTRTSVERVNSFPAVQYEVRGQVNQNAVAYLHTTVELGDSFYQVVVWTPDNLRISNSAAMRAIAQEFRQTQP